MSARVLTCLRCGHEGVDVAMSLVDLEAEAKADRTSVRTVDVELVRDLRHVRGVVRVRARELYAAEWRCRDRVACTARVSAGNDPAPVAHDAEEDAPWY